MDSERTRLTHQVTGDSRVDEAVAELAALEELPLDDRPAALEAVHDRLREILGELGEPPRPERPGRGGSPGEPRRHGEQGRHGEQDELGGQ
jgi:hypothetical protein